MISRCASVLESVAFEFTRAFLCHLNAWLTSASEIISILRVGAGFFAHKISMLAGTHFEQELDKIEWETAPS